MSDPKSEIELTEYECRIIELFADETAKTQQAIEFGQHRSNPRAIMEIARDTQIGKMAEVAVSKLLRGELGLHLPINYEVYPRGECDDNDIMINGWTMDVKSTRNGRWLLFERKKAVYRLRSGTLPDIIVMCKTPWDTITDKPQGRTIEIIGCIGINRLLYGGKGVHRISAGGFLPGTTCKLLADNYAVRSDDLDGVDSLTRYAKFMMDHRRGKNGRAVT